MIAGVVAMCLLVWTLFVKDPTVRFFAAFVGFGIVGFWSFGIGAAANRLKFYDQYTYRIVQYSAHLRLLAEQNRLPALTNAVIIFDQRFNKSQSAADLQDAVLQVLKMDELNK